MKKILLLLLIINSFNSFAQEDVFGNSPVKGIIPIKRGNIQETNVNSNRSASQNVNRTPSNPTGSSAEVGVTEGQLSISLTGGANYNIPIAVPPGINGIVPQVALSYNSQGGNGLAGYGWNVSGVSVITKIASTKYHDNIIDGVDFNSSDRFAFDGQRLLVKNGTTGIYGANETVYETESYSNVQITSYGVHPSGANYGPAYFIVQYPDGSIAHYGNSSDSKSLTDWAITYWQNPQGVKISYSYLLSNNNLSINTIKYGSTLTALPINEIAFVYKARQRAEQAYIGGQSFVRNTILSEIKVKGNTIGFRNYLLTHETTTLGYERLKSITEKSGDNTKSFNPTVFNYETTSENISFNTNNANLSVNNIRSDNSATVQGDFNGDGNMDIMLYPTTGADAKRKYWLFTDIQGSGMNIGSEHNLGSFTDIFPISWLSWNNKLMPAQGWCAVQNNTTTNVTTFNTYSTGTVSPIYFQYARTYQFPKMTFGYWTYPCVPIVAPVAPNIDVYAKPIPIDTDEPVYNVIERIIPKEHLSGDFNGDGLSDVVIIERPVSVGYYTGGCNGSNSTYNYSGGKAYFLNLDRRITTDYIFVAGYLQVTGSSKFVTADFNGDGKSDIFVFDNSVCRVYTLNSSNNTVLLTTINSGNITTDKPVLMGDYNGDGKADFIIPRENKSRLFTKYISTGTSAVINEVDLGIGEYFTGFYDNNKSSIQQIIPNDFNNDGKTDIILTKCNYVYSGYVDFVNQNRFISVRYFSNKGNSFESSMFTTKIDVYGLNHFPIPVTLSFDKANSNKQISFISNNNIYSAISPKDNIIDTSLKEVILGSGVKEVISYEPLIGYYDSYDNIFEPSTYTENYPNSDIKVATGFRVVSKLEQVTKNQYKQQKFKYFGAVSNLDGLGFLGFRGLARTNWYNDDNQAISSITKHDISKRGAVTESYSALGETYGNFTNYTPSNFINKTTMTYVDQLLSNKVFKISNPFTVSANGLDGTSKEVLTTVDIYNNPLSTTSTSKNGTTIERTELVNIEYFPNSTSPLYVLGRLKKKNSSVTHDGNTMTGEEIYTYNTAQLVSQIQKKGHLTNYLTEDNIYDVYGNITQKKVTAVGLSPRISGFNYDTSGRFLLSSTDIEGLVTSFTYNTSNGLLLTQTLPSNAGYPLITTNLYDVWGKKIKETDYLGKNLSFSYSWLSAGTSGLYMLSSSGEDNSASFVQFDELGRKIADGLKTVNYAYGGQSNTSWKTFEYDIYDRVKKGYEPIIAQNPQWSGLFSTTIYDPFGRTKQVIEHTGKTSNINYNGLTTSASDGVSNTTTIKNSLGSVVSMTDNGGTINYQYYANGNMKQSNFGGVIVSVEQDGWGRKTKLTDPSAGVYQYEYNEFGEMLKEITPKGQTKFTLDNNGKVTEKTIIGTGGDPTNTKTTHTYNPTTKLLTNTRYDDLAGGFFTLYTYSYDNYKRMNFSDESGFNAYYQKATQFDAFGRAEKQLYTAINTSDGKRSDKWVKNTYQNGHHYQVLDNATNQLLWQTSRVDAKGQLTRATYGNNIEVYNSYDQYGFPAQFMHLKPSYPEVNVMTLNTTFEPQRGNLINRSNSMFNYAENFEYDNLDRLYKFENSNLLIENKFNTEIGTFENTGCTLLLENNKLKIQIPNSSAKVRKLITSSAVVGKKYLVSAEISTNLDHGGYTIYEAANTSETSPRVPITVGLNNNFVVSTYPNIYIEFNVSDYENCTETQDCITEYDEYGLPYQTCTTYINCETVSGSGEVIIDDLNLSEFLIAEQTYDALGRITENNIGTYNYTNTAKPFHNTSVELKPTMVNYFQNDRSNLEITYNAFKSPIDIIEEGKDKLSFIYNMNNSRSTMYYGSLEADKLLRKYRKHYSADGTMEIKQDIANGTVEFITYIGGDAYSAPVILKSDGTTQEYMYLHRDYLGSIVAVTNQAGAVVEKRLFDAWGNITKVQDGNGTNLGKLTVIDRGYTGHEHLKGVNLIHMNGRLYDPVVHRFLQPDNFVSDPYSTQAFNRYSYVLNNPLKYSDASGELPVLVVAAIIGAIAGATGYVAHAIQTGNWSWSGFGMAVIGGAAVGALTGGLGGASATCVTLSAAGNAAASSFAAAFFPAISVPIGDWSISVSPSIAFGNAGGAGMSFGVSYSDGDWSFSGGVGIMAYSNYNGFGANANEIRYSILANYDDGKVGFSLGTNLWRGDFKQQTGVLGIHSGDFRAMYENDGKPFSGISGDGNDQYRTAALNLSVNDVSVGFNLFTGQRTKVDYKIENLGKHDGKVGEVGPLKQGKYGEHYKNGLVKESGTPYRLGALTVGYKGYSAGINSEWVRHAIQNVAIHGTFIANQRMFEMKSNSVIGYFQYKTPNLFTTW